MNLHGRLGPVRTQILALIGKQRHLRGQSALNLLPMLLPIHGRAQIPAAFAHHFPERQSSQLAFPPVDAAYGALCVDFKKTDWSCFKQLVSEDVIGRAVAAYARERTVPRPTQVTDHQRRAKETEQPC